MRKPHALRLLEETKTHLRLEKNNYRPENEFVLLIAIFSAETTPFRFSAPSKNKTMLELDRI